MKSKASDATSLRALRGVMKRVVPIVLLGAAHAAAQDRPPGAGGAATASVVSVRDCGAKGDGTADDSAAFQKAFEGASRSDHGVVRIPAGAYRLDRQVGVEFGGAVGNGLTVAGDGQGVSVIHCGSTNGAIRIRSELCQTQVTIRDLTLLADIPGAGTAIEVSSSLRGVRNYRTLTVQNVDMRGAGLPTRSYFSRGLLAFAQWRPIFQNVVFSGILDPALKETALAADALRHGPEYGFCADWSYAPSFQHCYAWSCDTGYRVASRDLKPEGPEDGAFHRCNAVGTRIGIDIDTPIIEPQLVIDACHLNCREAGIRIRNRKFFHVVNCLLYSGSEDQRVYTDIRIENCWAGVLSGNLFHSTLASNVKKDPPSLRTCIAVDKQSRNIVATGNIFNGKGAAFRIESGAKEIKMPDNEFINPHVAGPSPGHGAAVGETGDGPRPAQEKL